MTWPARVVGLVHRDVPLVVVDTVIVAFCYLFALVLRFDGSIPSDYWRNFLTFAPVVSVIHLLVNHRFGLYGQMWRYASVQEARRVVLAGLAGGACALVTARVWGGGANYLPLSVVGLGALLSLIGFGTIRFQSRLFAFRRQSVVSRRRVLVVGAGYAGSMVVKDILHHPVQGLEIVGLVDDDLRKVGRSLHGVRVLGTRSDIPALVPQLRIDQVLLAIPSATSEVVRDVATLCEEAHCTLRVLPTVSEIMGGRVTARDIRDLRIEDLLGRQQVEMDSEAVARMISGRRVLITGAGGSIGSEIARQVLAFSPSALLLLDHDETHLHDLQLALRPEIHSMDVQVGDLQVRATPRVESVLADVRDQARIVSVFFQHRPEVVFHAAAHKHVPFLETSPEEAVRTNIIGTANVAEAAGACSVGKFVLISTDKAVNPRGVMGASKWFAEQIVRSYGSSDTVFCAVRFGNVLGSRGSVIPTFFRQIAQGGPVTVTDPTMARYFMSVQEAVQLVLQAATQARGNEVFTLDMGEPVLIVELARRLIRLSGLVPERDIEIVFTGPRPGEKLMEELIADEEDSIPSSHPSIMVSRPPVPDLPTLRRALWELEALASEGRSGDLAERIKQIANARERVSSSGVA